mgnify:CR=1
MKLFKISQGVRNDYDTYDSAVVCAENEDEARHIHPSNYVTHYRDGKWYGNYSPAPHEEYETENGAYSSWVEFDQIDKIKVEYIGEASEGQKKGVIVASFNAG